MCRPQGRLMKDHSESRVLRFGFASWRRRLAIASKSSRSLPAQVASRGTITQLNWCDLWNRVVSARGSMGFLQDNKKLVSPLATTERGERRQSAEGSEAGVHGSEHGAVLGLCAAQSRTSEIDRTGAED